MTLKEISDLPLGTYRVIDSEYGVKQWYNIIHILYDGKHKGVRRHSAFKFGLCAPAQQGSYIETRGGSNKSSGRKAVKEADKKKPITVFASENQIRQFGNKEKLKQVLTNIIKRPI
jgi:hypothetical protein